MSSENNTATDQNPSRPSLPSLTSPQPQPHPARTLAQRCVHWLDQVLTIGLVILVGVSLLCLVVTLPILYFTDKHRSDIVESVEPAGQPIKVTVIGGLFSRTLLETDLGFYSLIEGVSLRKDQALTLERRANHRRFICDEKHHCTKLMDEW